MSLKVSIPTPESFLTSESGASPAQQLEMARKIALKLLDSKSRSVAELRAALLKRNSPPEIVEELVERFEEVGLLDDQRLAEAIVADQTQIAYRGPIAIKQRLQQRGISAEVAARLAGEITTDDQLEAARQVARRRAKSLAGLAEPVAARRLSGTLARRGFSPDVVFQVVRESTGKS